MKWLRFLVRKPILDLRRLTLGFLYSPLALVVGLTACSGTSLDNSRNETRVIDNSHPYFPTQKNVNVRMEVRTDGRLIIDHGYLRLNGYLLIWPNGFSFDSNDATIKILDEEKIEVARVGNMIILGGGIVEDKGMIEGYIDQKLPDGAVGPYWIVGEIQSNIPPGDKP